MRYTDITFESEDGVATITLDRRGLRVRIGDDSGDPHAVEDDSSFNESLNAIFNLYFDTEFSMLPDRSFDLDLENYMFVDVTDSVR